MRQGFDARPCRFRSALSTGGALYALALCAPLLVASQAHAQVTIPFELKDNLPKIEAIVNGQPASAVLDSGTGALLIDRGFNARVGGQSGGASGYAQGGGTQAQAIYPTVVGSLDVGPIHLTNVQGIAMDTSALATSAGFPIDAILGRPVFGQQAIRVDYVGRRITFFPASAPPACSSPIPVDVTSGVPIATVTLRDPGAGASTTLRLVVDLGTRHYAAMIGGAFLDTPAGKVLLARGKPEEVGTGTGGAVEGVSVKIAKLDVGPDSYQNLTIALTRQVPAFEKGVVDGTLGVPLWQSGQITFDYPHGQLCLETRSAFHAP